jgi:hypothetical protein
MVKITGRVKGVKKILTIAGIHGGRAGSHAELEILI